jgi:hypothetical protein
MDIQVNKDQLDRIIIKWLNNNYGDLKKEKYEFSINDNSYSYSKKNSKKILMDYNTNNKVLHVEDVFLGSLIDLFKIDFPQLKRIIKKWVYETYHIDAIIVNGAYYNS